MNEPATRNARPARAASRTAARLAAVQALYQMDMAATDANLVVREFLDHRLEDVARKSGADETDGAYFKDIVLGVVREQLKIDPVLEIGRASGRERV